MVFRYASKEFQNITHNITHNNGESSGEGHGICNSKCVSIKLHRCQY